MLARTDHTLTINLSLDLLGNLLVCHDLRKRGEHFESWTAQKKDARAIESMEKHLSQEPYKHFHTLCMQEFWKNTIQVAARPPNLDLLEGPIPVAHFGAYRVQGLSGCFFLSVGGAASRV